MSEDRKQAARARMKQAQETLKEAEVLFEQDLSRAFHVWFDERQTSDYGEIWDIEYTEAQTALTEAKSFVKTIESYLDEQLNIS
jgi:uncharacterized protein (UPF0332 family)